MILLYTGEVIVNSETRYSAGIETIYIWLYVNCTYTSLIFIIEKCVVSPSGKDLFQKDIQCIKVSICSNFSFK